MEYGLAPDVVDYEGVVLQAAETLAARYNPVVGATRSWDFPNVCSLHPQQTTDFPVIIDNMMNLELLLWGASRPGGRAEWRDIAIDHADVTAREIVRQDGSTFHVGDFDPQSGESIFKVCFLSGAIYCCCCYLMTSIFLNDMGAG